MADIDQIQTPDAVTYDIISKISRGLTRANMESTSTNNAFVITAPGITELYDGCTIIVKNTVIASAKNCTLNLNNLGAKRIWMSQDNGYCTTHWGLNQDQIFVYDATNNRWEFWQGRDTTNSDTKVRQILTSSSIDTPLLMSYANISSTTTNVDNVVIRNNDIYANPSTGNITAINFNGKLNNRNHEWINISDTEATGGDLITIPSSWDCQEIYILVRVHTYNVFVPFMIPVISIAGTASAPMIFRGGWHMTSNNGGMVAVEVFYNAANDICVRLVTCFLNGDTVLNSSFTKVYIKN